jgi:hypothetical protein
MSVSHWPALTRTGAAVVAAVALWSAIGHGQPPTPPAAKAMLREAALPAIDRGLRDQEPPRAAPLTNS